jgi:choline dehydrogenase
MAGGFVRSDSALDLPDVQLHFQPVSNVSPGVFHEFPGGTLTVSQMRPESRGEITLRTADPAQPPAMCANYLTTARDTQVVVAALRLGREIMRQPAFSRFSPLEIAPGEGYVDDDSLLAHARATGSTQFHLTSSCRMGVDDLAVVDTELRVRGLEGLRVADASVMPAVVSGNTNAAAVMIGEKAADLILGRAPLISDTPRVQQREGRN